MNCKARLLAVKHLTVPPVRTVVVWQTPSLFFSYTITPPPHTHPRGEGGRLRFCIDLGKCFQYPLICARAFSSRGQCHVLWCCFVFLRSLYRSHSFCLFVFMVGFVLLFEQLVLSTSQVSIASSVTYVSVLSPVSHTSQYCHKYHMYTAQYCHQSHMYTAQYCRQCHMYTVQYCRQCHMYTAHCCH